MLIFARFVSRIVNMMKFILLTLLGPMGLSSLAADFMLFSKHNYTMNKKRNNVRTIKHRDQLDYG